MSLVKNASRDSPRVLLVLTGFFFFFHPARIILMEMEAHADAWPFLEPVNPRLVPGYRRIIKNPMDFLTMRERLLQGE